MVTIIYMIGAIGGIGSFCGLTVGVLAQDELMKNLGVGIMLSGSFIAAPMVFHFLYNMDYGDGGLLPFQQWFGFLLLAGGLLGFVGGCFWGIKSIIEFQRCKRD